MCPCWQARSTENRQVNVSIFFIPFLGAAASGRATSVSPSREAIVVLLGPIPGIVIGCLLLFALGGDIDPRIERAAKLAIGLNAFNLLPLMPLDARGFRVTPNASSSPR